MDSPVNVSSHGPQHWPAGAIGRCAWNRIAAAPIPDPPPPTLRHGTRLDHDLAERTGRPRRWTARCRRRCSAWSPAWAARLAERSFRVTDRAATVRRAAAAVRRRPRPLLLHLDARDADIDRLGGRLAELETRLGRPGAWTLSCWSAASPPTAATPIARPARPAGDLGGGRPPTARLRRRGRRPPVLFVPSLVNRAYVLDLVPGRSMLRWLAGAGVRPLLLDWGWPGAVERGFTLTDYIAGRLERASRRSGAPVVLAGYCMGGLLAVAAALRRPERVRASRCWRRRGISTPRSAADAERLGALLPGARTPAGGHRHAAGRRAAGPVRLAEPERHRRTSIAPSRAARPGGERGRAGSWRWRTG